MLYEVITGNAHFACESDEHTIEMIKELLEYLPNNNLEEAPQIPMGDEADRLCPNLDTIIPDDPKMAYDMHKVLEEVRITSYNVCYTKLLRGMQPQFRQMPPRWAFSTTAVFNFNCAARIAAT